MSASIILWQKQMKKSLIHTEEIVGMLIQPILWVVLFGVGMRSHAGVALKMFATLAKENINIMMISTSEIKVSCVIEEKYTELAVRELHRAFGLDDEDKEDR